MTDKDWKFSTFSHYTFGRLKEFRAEKLKVAVPKLGLAFPQHHPQKLTAALPLMKLTEIESSITLDTRIMYRRFLAGQQGSGSYNAGYLPCLLQYSSYNSDPKKPTPEMGLKG